MEALNDERLGPMELARPGPNAPDSSCRMDPEQNPMTGHRMSSTARLRPHRVDTQVVSGIYCAFHRQPTGGTLRLL
jgi:hypothetical protein